MFSTASTAPPKLSVVIAGGGVAAMETALALRSLAGPRVAMRLVAPEPEFTYRPLSVGEPFARSRPTRHSLPELAAAAGAQFVQERVARVDGPRRCLRLASGEGLEYDALVLATGALARAADPRALTFGGSPSVPAVRDLLAALRGGTVHDVAFAVPAGASWPLPLYELAIMTAREILGEGAPDARFWLLSREAAPLAAFGPTASNAIAALLERAGVRFVGLRRSTVFPGTVLAGAEGREHMVQRVVTLPVAEGRRIPGVPHDRAGFIPVDPFGRVPGLPDVYAAGTERRSRSSRAASPRSRPTWSPRPSRPTRAPTSGPSRSVRSCAGS
jgi:sulfide:quinone oxidoreductase